MKESVYSKAVRILEAKRVVPLEIEAVQVLEKLNAEPLEPLDDVIKELARGSDLDISGKIDALLKDGKKQ